MADNATTPGDYLGPSSRHVISHKELSRSNDHHRFHRVASLSLLAILGVMLQGCAARTRLGALIPAHVRSQKIEGEFVSAHFIRLPEEQNEEHNRALPLVAPLAGLAANALVDFASNAIRNELAKEADAYQHSYSARLLLTTRDLDRGGVVVVIRWVDSDSAVESSEVTIVPPADSQIVDAAAPADAALKRAIETLTTSIPGKVPAAILTMRVTHDGEYVYRLSGSRLQLDSVGAKVVDYGWRNLPKVWELLGAAIFKTDSQATFLPVMKVKAVVASKVDKNGNVEAAEWNEIAPDDAVLAPKTNVNLDKLPRIFELGSNTGAWLYVPTIGDAVRNRTGKTTTVVRNGYVVMDFGFTESDASNARKYVLQGVNYIDENKEAWGKQANSAVAGLLGGKD